MVRQVGDVALDSDRRAADLSDRSPDGGPVSPGDDDLRALPGDLLAAASPMPLSASVTTATLPANALMMGRSFC
jgi:hypothetical protein